jgi:hypothetical protein
MRTALRILVIAAALIAFAAPVWQASAAPAAPAKPKKEGAAPYTTEQCFAFWTLLNKLQHDGVPALMAKGPQGPDGGLPPAEMQRVTLYLKLEEKLLFRCPDFAPPPVPRPADVPSSSG